MIGVHVLRVFEFVGKAAGDQKIAGAHVIFLGENAEDFEGGVSKACGCG
jgi:hypothetical protein